jgi:hypothetical protein
MGMNTRIDLLSGEYAVSVQEIEEAIAMIEVIEKISYPNI